MLIASSDLGLGYFLWIVIIGAIIWHVHNKRQRFANDLESGIEGATRVITVRAKRAPQVIAQFEGAGWKLQEKQLTWRFGLRPWVTMTFVRLR